jgi:hypothetical protein
VPRWPTLCLYRLGGVVRVVHCLSTEASARPDEPISNMGHISWDVPAAFPSGGSTLAVEVSKFVVDADLGADVLRQSLLSNNVTLGARAASDAAATLVTTAFGACEACGAGSGKRSRDAFCLVDNEVRPASECVDSEDVSLSAACEIAEYPVYAISVVEPRSSVVAVTEEPVLVRWGGGSRERLFTIELAPVAREIFGDRVIGDFSPIGSSVNSSTFSWTPSATTRTGAYVVRVVDDMSGMTALSESFLLRQRRVVYTLSWQLKDISAVPTGVVARVTLFGMRTNATLPTDGANVDFQRGAGWARLVSFSDEWLDELIGHESISSGSLVSWASLDVAASLSKWFGDYRCRCGKKWSSGCRVTGGRSSWPCGSCSVAQTDACEKAVSSASGCASSWRAPRMKTRWQRLPASCLRRARRCARGRASSSGTACCLLRGARAKSAVRRVSFRCSLTA